MIFQYANLNGANLSDSDLTSAVLKGARLKCTNLSRADLRGVDLDNVNLNETDLTGAVIQDQYMVEGKPWNSCVVTE